MKNLVYFLSLVLLLGGCKYFKKSSSKTVDTIQADTITEELVDSSSYYNETTDQSTVNNVIETGNASAGKYYMIVGCFTISENASKYAEKIRGMGYDGQIISGRNNFQMVSARSFNNFRESVNELDKFRNDVTPNAWVYLQR